MSKALGRFTARNCLAEISCQHEVIERFKSQFTSSDPMIMKEHNWWEIHPDEAISTKRKQF
jgi:hypothetical protein